MRLNRGSWRRLREIAEVLAHHGLLWASDNFGLAKYLGLKGRIRAKTLPPITADWPERVRLVLAELGPTYIKLGQLASIRPDVLPEALVRSLERLQDDVPPFSHQEAVDIVESAWGRPLRQVLQEFDPRPLGAASIGQVHLARLADGRDVVIKVRRPDIMERSEADFRILRVVAERAEKRSVWAKQNHLGELVAELVATMRDELDFTVEAHNTDTARKNLSINSEVIVPEVIWELTRPNVLVMEWLGGVKINDQATLARWGIPPHHLAQTFVHSLYQQIFRIGLFHADPHPGNVHVDSEGRVILLDWGMVGVLSRDMRSRSVQLVLGLVQGKSEPVADALVAVGAAHHHVDRRALIRDVDRLRRRYYETHLKDFHLGQALGDLFSVAQRHQLRIPAEYLLMAKAAVIADGVVRELDPEFSLLEMGKPLALELFFDRVDPRHWVPGAASEAYKLGSYLMGLPEEFDRALKTLSRGEIRIVLEHKNIDRMLGHWARLANRLALSFLMGAIVLATALVVQPSELDRFLGVPVGEYAFLAALAASLVVIIALVAGKKL